MQKKTPGWLYPLLASLSLGMAPFQPEPHLFGKIRWVTGGANGMQFMDWFDLVLHSAPWVWLFVSITSRSQNQRAVIE
jgi:hypothetical protein